jgi:hypothetical protein
MAFSRLVQLQIHFAMTDRLSTRHYYLPHHFR